MAEYFEITLFIKHEDADDHRQFKNMLLKYGLALGENQINICTIELLNHQSVLIDIFEETDYDLYTFCFSNIKFTKERFHETLVKILCFVNTCFCHIDDICFATGIYELTYYLIENIASINDVNSNILRRFPFVFWKGENFYRFSNVIHYKTISYVVNSGKETQDIFSDF